MRNWIVAPLILLGTLAHAGSSISKGGSSGGGSGTITGITTAGGSGLSGGATSGTVSLTVATGDLPAAVTLPAAQISAGTLPATVLVTTASLSANNTATSGDILTAVGNKITYTTPLTNVMQTTSNDTVTGAKVYSSSATWNSYTIFGSSAITVADNGAGTAAAFTLDVSAALGAPLYTFTCSDANNCNITVSETGMLTGVHFCAVNISPANSIVWADTSGVTELASAFTAGPLDFICMTYISDRWIETNRSNN